MAYGVQNEICESKTVKNPKLNPSETHVEENNINKLTPVIISGLKIEKLLIRRVPNLLNLFASYKPNTVIIPINKHMGTTITDNNNEFNKPFKKVLSFHKFK
jgi:hypothetical protein